MRTVLALSALLLAASCVAPPRRAPVPPTRAVIPPPPAAPIPRPTDWRDWPQTPGDWTYQRVAGGSVAVFGTATAPLASLRCDAAARTVILALSGAAPASATVRTSSLARYLPLVPGGDGAAARLSAQDPLLDAIGFSRGRFAIELPGAEPLALPAWPEVERVVEDCRG